MKYIKVNEALKVVAVADSMPEEMKVFNPDGWYKKADGSKGAGWLNRWDIDSFMLAQVLADSASELLGVKYLASDSGPNVSPRYDVIEAPKLGDDASRAFNGDYYPVGKIVSISQSMRLIVARDERGLERKFYRRKLSGAWVNKGMWSLVPGVRSEWNPEF